MSENVMKKGDGIEEFLSFLKKIEKETKGWPEKIKRSALHLFASDETDEKEKPMPDSAKEMNQAR